MKELEKKIKLQNCHSNKVVITQCSKYLWTIMVIVFYVPMIGPKKK
jgi:hypothetical protein